MERGKPGPSLGSNSQAGITARRAVGAAGKPADKALNVARRESRRPQPRRISVQTSNWCLIAREFVEPLKMREQMTADEAGALRDDAEKWNSVVEKTHLRWRSKKFLAGIFNSRCSDAIDHPRFLFPQLFS